MNELRNALVELKLHGMVDALDLQRASVEFANVGFEERALALAFAELSKRDSQRVKRILKVAKFRYQVNPTQIECDGSRGIDRPFLSGMLTSDWVRQKQNVVITGPAGTGKTWLACGLGMAAATKGLQVRYYRAWQLYEDIAVAAAQGSSTNFHFSMLKNALVIIDDFGLQPIPSHVKAPFLELIDALYFDRSLMFAGQLPFKDWYGWVGDPRASDSFSERVRENCHFIELKGESWRRPIP